MEKKGMLYKRTFSAAASALMVLSACAPMSVFAEEFTEATSTFDIVNESEQVPSGVYLNTSFNDTIAEVKSGFDDAAKAKDKDDADAAKKRIATAMTGDDVYLAIRTKVAGMIDNAPGRPKVINKNTNEYAVQGKMTLKIDLGDLLGVSGNSYNLLMSVKNGLNNLKRIGQLGTDVLNTTLNGSIKLNINLPKEASFDKTGIVGVYDNCYLVKRVSLGKDNGVVLELNPEANLGDLLNLALSGDGDTVKIELPYTVTYTLKDNKVQNLNDVSVWVDDNTEMFTGTSTMFSGAFARKILHVKANYHESEEEKNATFDILKSLSANVKEEPVKPSKPSGTLTGGYPTSKPGNSTSTSSVRAMYRLYNPKTAEHFYTQSAEERDNLVRGGWNNEGIGWHAPTGSSTPVYRVFNPNSGDHHYTTNLEEYQTLTRIGWNAEGIGWYSASDKGAPIYRLYNKNIKVGSHHYTQNAAERDKLVNEGWVYEGIAWYAVK